MLRRIALSCLVLLSFTSCEDDPVVDGGIDASVIPDPTPPAPFESLNETARYVIPELTAHAYVVRTEHDVPHIYAENRLDAARLLGFTMATDRYFQMDLTSRLAQGLLTELLGDLAFETDLENRQIGMAYMVQLFADSLDEEERAALQAFADGVNAHVDAVTARQLDAPKELELAFGLLGGRNAAALMRRWEVIDVVAAAALVLFNATYETGDPRRAASFENFDSHFVGFPDRDLRLAGLQTDIVDRYAPPNDSSSTAGWGLETTGTTSSPIVDPRRPHRPIPIEGPHFEVQMLARLTGHLDRLEERFHPNGADGWGSNAWAVMGSATPDGRAIMASDGHLGLTAPTTFWRYGLDTQLMGDSDPLTVVGNTLPGLPVMGSGTNGRVAWSQTAFQADVTDWYTEEILLDAAGAPRATRFAGAEQPLNRIEDIYEVADLPALESVGRTETVARYTTFDGRWISSIEGREVTAEEAIGANETRVNLMGTYIVPMDMDGDSTISAVSFYYGPFDGGSVLRAFRGFEDATTVEEFRQSMRHFVGYGGGMVAADGDGSVLYSGYHAVPCREYLPRDGTTNVWIAGADPTRLIDGTLYGAWSIPMDARQRVDEAAASAGGPEACAVPFDRWPQALNPAQQYVNNHNNDPGNIATDDDLFDDPYYIGGPWLEGFRAARADEVLDAHVSANDYDIAAAMALQGDTHSNLGEEYTGYLLEAIDAARTEADGTPTAGSAEERMAATWTADQTRLLEVETRIMAWRDADFPAESGVDTFYDTSTATTRDMAVATTIFNHWMGRWARGITDDEGIDFGLSPGLTGDSRRTMLLDQIYTNRGPTRPDPQGSWNPNTEESVFFDDVTTTEIESSEEISLRALVAALDYMESPTTAPGEGGFGTADMDQWLWGLRHQVRFEALLGDFIDGDGLGALLDAFNIQTSRFPLAADIPAGDPREGLIWFPRHGDHLGIDAGNSGFNGERFTYGSGPVFRQVFSLGADGVRGVDMLPGGQSGNPDSEFFADQAAEWLANNASPLRFTPAEVLEGAVSIERYAPNLPGL